jgi:alpha-mannosidase
MKRLLPLLLLVSAARVAAVEVTTRIAPDEIKLSASGSWGGVSPQHAIDDAGMNDDDRHDNEHQSGTSWHTAMKPEATTPAPGVPAAPAWLRFDFKEAKPLGKCLIWNHNQANQTDRGFRHAQLFVTTDGVKWEAVKVGGLDTFEIPRAKGTATEPMTLAFDLPGKPVKSAVLLAKDNHGGNVFGLSAVRFLTATKDVPEAQLAVPTGLKATDFPFSEDGKGGWNRSVTVALEGAPLHQAARAKITAGGKTRVVDIAAKFTGRKSLTLPLPEGEGAKRNTTEKIAVELVAAGRTVALDTAITPPAAYPNLEEVVVTWKCHLDIGYTHTVPEVIAKYRGHDMDAILGMFEKTKDRPADDRFRWMLPAWAMETVLDKDQTPERRAKLEQAVRDNRLMWHAIPFTFESDAADLEELVRGLGYGTRLSKRFGVPLVKDAKQTDMPEQAWVLPTLLKHAGVDFLHIGSNDGSKTPAQLNNIPTLSWWEGADGSRVLLGYSAYYGWDSIVPPGGWKHKSWLAFFVKGDNQGPPSPQQVESILAQGRKALPGVKIRFGRPSDFAATIIREEKENPTLPVIRADMPDTWCHGQMSTPEPTGVHRRAATLLGTLGQLDTTLRAYGLAPEAVSPLLEDGYRNGGFYAEHTWGLNGGYFRGTYGDAWKKKYDAGEYKKFDATYAYHMDYGRKAMADAKQGVEPRLKLLADSVKCDGPRIVVFNPLPWERDAIVEVEAMPGVVNVIDLATGTRVAFEKTGKTLRIAAKSLPAGGYKTFALGDNGITGAIPQTYANGILKTAKYTARFDLEKGGIASLVENATGRELVAKGGHALGQFLHERFTIDQVNSFMRDYVRPGVGWAYGDFGKAGMPDAKKSPYAAMTPTGWKVIATSSGVADTVRMVPSDTLGLAGAYELTFTFPKNQGCVDIGWSVKNKTPNPIPEGGWLCLPFNVEHPAFRLGRVGGTIDPAKDIAFFASRNLFTVDRGVTVRAGATGAGVAVASADLPLWSLGKSGLWLYEPAYVPTSPEVFVNLYNNMWSTNYPLWVDGSWSASLRLWPVAAGETEQQAHFTPAWELRQPPVAAFADGKGGALPASQSGVSLSRKNARVTAYCPNPDGAGVVLRLWEQSGESGDITVTLPTGTKATKARPVTLRGEPTGEPIVIRNGKFTTALGAWAPASFVLE